MADSTRLIEQICKAIEDAEKRGKRPDGLTLYLTEATYKRIQSELDGVLSPYYFEWAEFCMNYRYIGITIYGIHCRPAFIGEGWIILENFQENFQNLGL